jgi:hypothetical protein
MFLKICLLGMVCFAFLFAVVFLKTDQYGEKDYQREKSELTEQFVAFDPNEQATVVQVSRILQAFDRGEVDQIWPGYRITLVPTILTFHNGHIYAFHLQSEDPCWKTWNIEGQRVLFSDQDKWGLLETPLHPKFPIEGREAYVICMDMISPVSHLPYLVFVHERFHRHQLDMFQEISEEQGPYLDHLKHENLALMQLEERILHDFLQSLQDPRISFEHKKEYLKLYVAVNKARRGLLQESSVAWELHQQKMEGLADYVSVKTFDVFPVLSGFNGTTYLCQLLGRYAEDNQISDRAIKWRHYGVGAGLGYALDFLNVSNWKEKVEKEGATQTLLLEESIGLTDGEVKENLVQAKHFYNFDHIQKSVTATVNEYENAVEHFLQEFHEMDGVTVSIAKPAHLAISGGGVASHTFFLANGSTMVLDDSSVSTTSDQQWKMKLEDIPLVFQNHKGAKEFKAEKELVIHLDGENYSLQELLEKKIQKAFHTITWKGKTSEFSSEGHPGTISVRDGKVSIMY